MLNSECEFMKKINNVKPLYTQMLNGKRVQNNDVIYIFDEVGCGKTISAIIAMASVITKKENESGRANILVITPKSVSEQFLSEIKKTLVIENDEIVVKNMAYLTTEKTKKYISNISNSCHTIIVANKEKAENLKMGQPWDLIIIDEAHDIVCNNQKQSEVYFGEKIEEAYTKYLEKIEQVPEKQKERMEYCLEFIKELKMKENIKFIKYLVIEEYNYLVRKNHKDNPVIKEISIPHHRKEETRTFANLSLLKSKKIIFLTATPYKNDKDIDFLNYALMASEIVTDKFFSFKCLPSMNWVQKIYSANFDKKDIKEMEESNTSFFFKEITRALPIKSNNKEECIARERKVEVWVEGKKGFSISKKIRSILGETQEIKESCRNRIIIFVSSSKEGGDLFKKIFDTSYDIVHDSDHMYKDKNEHIICEFVMNKFGNANNLSKYAKENESIPDVLIVTYQVAQVGVNLPTFNYVLNYHISPIPGYLEQRYGRIDRLSTKHNPLWNIYYIDTTTTSNIYNINLIQALHRYKYEIMDTPHNMPVKNLLICQGLNLSEIKCEILYNDLACHVYYYESLYKEIKSINFEGIKSGDCIFRSK